MSETSPIIPPVITIPPANPQQAFDPKGLIEASKGVVPADGQGFMPLASFDPKIPYQKWADFLGAQKDTLEQERQRVDAQDPRTFFEAQTKKLEGEKDKIEEQRKAALDKRLADLEAKDGQRIRDLLDYQGREVAWRDTKIGDLEGRISTQKEEIRELTANHIADNNQRLDENTRHYEARIAELERHRAELANAIGNTWNQTKTTCEHIQQVIQARESKSKVSDYLNGTTAWKKYLYIGGTIFITGSLLTLAVSLIIRWLIIK